MPQNRDIVVIGASAGGVEALRRLVGSLPADFPAAVFIVLHIGSEAKSLLPPILARVAQLPARHPEHGESIKPGTIYVAPNDQHMLVERDRILLVRGPRENRTRPAINPLFRTAAAAFGPRVIGVILTGMLDDGTAGLWAVKQCGGTAIVQDPADAEFDEMPQSALDHVRVDHRLPLADIAAALSRLARAPAVVPAPPVPKEIKMSNDAVKMESNGFEMDKLAKRSAFTCPECNGALWELDEGGQLQFRCHVGHAYSPRTLESDQQNVIEQSLWSALRALKETAALEHRLADRTAAQGLDKAAAAYRESSAEKMQQAAHLLDFLNRLHGTANKPDEDARSA